jgi:glycosyltransferase involved in cell wall biosynthesis
MTSASTSPTIDDILVSCLLVTLPVPERLPYVKESVDAFTRQTHPSKELVVIVNGGTETGRRTLINYLASLERPDIRIVTPPGDLTLGHLRNIAFENAAGDVLCQWDDDDLYHPERLAKQLEALVEGGHDAVYLQEVMQFFPRSRTLYWTNWQATEAQAHPGSLLAKRSTSVRYPVDGPNARLGEDLQVALFLKSHRSVRFLSGMPHLFIYVSHGENSWSIDHHEMLASTLAISKGLLSRREAQLRVALKPFSFGESEVEVRGANGTAFKIGPEPAPGESL